MAIDPYTLNNLYKNGIIDYVDPSFCVAPVSAQMTAAVNPYANVKNDYLNEAAQGNLYKNHGMQTDSFTFSGSNIYNSAEIGSKSNSFDDKFGQNGIGVAYQGDILGTGDMSVGAKYQGGGENAYGGFADARNSINGGISKVQSVYSNTPSFIKGIAAIAIGILGIKMLFRGKKPVTKKSFWSRLNPANWGKKNVTPTNVSKKSSLWSKLKSLKKKIFK